MSASDSDLAEIERRWRESGERSRDRRARGRVRGDRRPRLLAGCAGLAFAAAALGLPGEARETFVGTVEVPPSSGASSLTAGVGQVAGVRVDSAPPRPASPSSEALREARAYARRAGGLVAFAVVDSQGRLRGRLRNRQFVAASVVKAMLLAAELRRLAGLDVPIDAATDETLRGMITESDNDAADVIYYRVGDKGLHDVAKAARMGQFTVDGYWANAMITARDMARFFSRLRKTMPRPYLRYARRLLASITPDQRWGIAEAAGRGWRVRFKGGWRQTGLGSLVHQAAELRHGDTRLSLAVLTDGQPSQERGIEIVRGVAARLLRRG
jgi:beta-lactamase family protein